MTSESYMKDSQNFTIADALDALHAIDAGADRETWVRILAAAKAAGLSLDQVDHWSSGGGNYKGKRDLQQNWKLLKADGAITASTLFFLAREAGWRPRAERPAPSKPHSAPKKQAEDWDVAKTAQMRKAMSNIVAGALAAPEDHPYLTRKRINPEGLLAAERTEIIKRLGYEPQADGVALSGELLLIVPYSDITGALMSIEFIDEEGRKASIYKMPRKDAMWLSAPVGNARRIGICEGMATAKTLQSTYTCEVLLAAGSIANMANVANAVRHARPTAELVIFGELGKSAATARSVADAVFGTLVLPDEKSMPSGGTDFNDMAQEVGIEEVAQYIEPRLIHPRRVSFTAARQWIDIDYVLPGLEPGSVGMVVGPGGVGKTYLCLQIAASIAAGRSLIGESRLASDGKPAKVLLLLGEDSCNQLSNRLHSIRAAYGITEGEDARIDDNLEIYSLQGYDMLLLRQDGNTLSETTFIARLKQLCTGKRLAFIDPLIRLHESDENDNTAASRLMMILTSIADETGCAIVALHHSPKGDKMGVRGASALTTSARWILSITGPTDEEIRRHSIPDEEVGLWMKCQSNKMNYGGIYDAMWFRRLTGGALKAADPEAKDFERSGPQSAQGNPAGPKGAGTNSGGARPRKGGSTREMKLPRWAQTQRSNPSDSEDD